MRFQRRWGVALLVVTLCLGQMGVKPWRISSPETNSSFTTTSNVAGNGPVSLGQTVAVFQFGKYLTNGDFLSDQEDNVSPTYPSGLPTQEGTWAKTLTAPSGGWQQSPLMPMGMGFVRDHVARIKWTTGTPDHSETAGHLVY